MTEDLIELYDTFNTKGCPDKRIFGYLNDQLILLYGYNILNDYNDNDNNISVISVDDWLCENKWVEDPVMLSYEDINYEIIINDDDRLASDIEPPPLIFR